MAASHPPSQRAATVKAVSHQRTQLASEVARARVACQREGMWAATGQGADVLAEQQAEMGKVAQQSNQLVEMAMEACRAHRRVEERAKEA